MKTNLYLLVVAVILTCLSVWRCNNIKSTFVDISEAPRLFAGFREDKVSSIVIRKADLKAMEERKKKAKLDKKQPFKPEGQEEFIWKNETVLIRKGGKWMVHFDKYGIDFPADESSVKELLKNLKNIPASKTDIVAEDKKSHEEYEVDEKHATHVIALEKDGSIQAYLLIGRKPKSIPGESSSNEGIFVRKKDTPQVIRYDQSYWSVDPDPHTWTKKEVLSFERDKVKRLIVKNPKGEFTVEKVKKGTWRLKKPIDYPAKSMEVDSIINYLSSLYMEEVVGPRTPETEAKYGLGAGVRYIIKVEMEGKEKATHTLRIGKRHPEKESQYYAAIDDKPYVVTIAKYDSSGGACRLASGHHITIFEWTSFFLGLEFSFLDALYAEAALFDHTT